MEHVVEPRAHGALGSRRRSAPERPEDRSATPAVGVPLCDLTRQARALRHPMLEAVGRVLASGQYVLGAEVEAFEQEMAAFLGVNHAIGVGSGTDALWLGLKALGVGPGDRVLTTPFTFFATASAILNVGAEPVFADIDPETFNLSPEQARLVLEGRSPVHRRMGIRPETIKALIPVHLYGLPADMEALINLAQGHGLSVVEDAAQALGASYQGQQAGTVGTVGTFSFFPTKNLGGAGDGGLLVGNDEMLADRVRCLRTHGSRPKYFHHMIGLNSRLDALQAALLRVKLEHVNAWIAARQSRAAVYDKGLEGLRDIETPHRPVGRTHTYHQYTVRIRNGHRDALAQFLRARGVETGVYYPLSLHLQPALQRQGYHEGDLPASEQASREVLSLPMFPELSHEEHDWVVMSIQNWRP